jgi:basic membrane lipoprotein Med (substrate-binding protein (PBP1-ABC) superfamily)
MASEYYADALKAGKKCFAEARARDENPYLRVLEEDREGLDTQNEISLGVVDIPLGKIVGTSAHARSLSFARNFMPILPDGTEFASKWSNLCESHLEVGIQMPIEVYEFLNLYYVVEGNKRVSVLKFFDAETIPGRVTRIMPRRSDEPAVRIYFEFLDFYKISKVNYVWFTEEGAFASLCSATGMQTEEAWKDEDARTRFHSNYYQFRKIYKDIDRDRLRITTGDAFLKYINVFGYKTLYDETEAKIRENLAVLWPELQFESDDNPVDLSMKPAEPVKKSILTSLFAGQPKTIKAAFVYADSPDKVSWAYAHELGRQHVEDVMQGRVITERFDNVSTDPDKGSEELGRIADQGFDVIFTTSATLITPSVKAAILHPQTRFLNCSVNLPYQHVRTYSGRMHEAKYISGAIAGSMTETDKIGYITDFPTAPTIASINAFALGAQLVNPRAQIYLEYTALKDRTERPADSLGKLGVDIMSMQDMISPTHASRRYGVFKKNPDGEIWNLAMPVFNWGVFYEKILESLENGSYDEQDGSGKAINYWWGMASHVIDIIYSEKLPERTRRLAEMLRRMVHHRAIQIFEGEIRDNEGNIQVPSGSFLDVEGILNMNWLAENVNGTIPPQTAFRERAALALDPARI